MSSEHQQRGPVFVAGGQGMWDIALGPITGQLAQTLLKGEALPELVPFDPLR